MMSNFFGGGGGHEPPARNNIFLRSYKCYSPAFIGNTQVNKGNKIILPSSALAELARLKITYPMTFMISNPHMSKKSYCGVLEFSAEEGNCHIPVWMMD
jgi:ubiquitin fusion degradation protein 1